MSSSNCCCLTCIQIYKEAGQVVWYSYLSKNFPELVVVHTIKGFGIVNKAEKEIFLELLLFWRSNWCGQFDLWFLMVNGIVSLISFSDTLFLVYRNVTDFCILLLYLAALANSSMIPGSFLVASLGFSIYSIMSFTNSDSFITFPIWTPVIYFYSLIAVARTSKTMLNKSGKKL